VNEFGTKAYHKPLRIAMRVIAVLLFLAFVGTWVILMNLWADLDIPRVYLYMAIFVGYVLIERRTFRGPDEDAYTERIWVRYLLTYAWWFLVLGSLLEHALTLRSQSTVTIIGAVISLLGLALGYWATGVMAKSLGKRVDTWAAMRVVDQGPYAYIRHPAYLSSMLVVIGLPLVLNAYLSLSLSVVLVVLFIQRLRFEERILIQRMPAYAAYAQRTRRLLPSLW